MQKEIDKVDGVEWCLGMNSVIGSSIPSDMIPSSMKEMLQVMSMRCSLSVQITNQQPRK